MGSRLYAHLLGSPEDHLMCLNTIATREPMMQYVIELLNNLCLKKGVCISIAFTKPDRDFQTFFEQYFVSILPSVLRYKLYCGFIPWVVHQHPVTGDKMPMLVPLGSFTWHVRTKSTFANKEANNRSKKRRTSSWGVRSAAEEDDDGASNNNLDHNCASEYVVEGTGDMGVRTCDINVINLIDPMLVASNVTPSQSNRSVGCNIPGGQAQLSPLYVALQKYLALDLAQQRRCYADDWNTTARLFTTKTPPTAQNERAGRDEIPYGTTRFQQAQMPEGFFTYDNMKLQYQKTTSIVQDALEQTGGRGSEHVPAVYSLPPHYNLVQQPELKPLMDIELLEKQYRVAVAQSLGIPLHLIDSDTGTSRNISNDDLPFSSEMVKNTCENLTGVMSKVLLHLYSTVYHGDSAKLKKSTTTSNVRFKFTTEELYSENMKNREDDRTKLQKADHSSSGGKDDRTSATSSKTGTTSTNASDSTKKAQSASKGTSHTSTNKSETSSTNGSGEAKK
ncbi:hypothetical protein T484DRAFT_1757291 [Baffinella frigidus]|nr:hypothetical protein T484DRAFT_1757291 [Cryptophyta sp. CCMP2293]